jgi:DNA (cytosine-5)-methyltransferase 1
MLHVEIDPDCQKVLKKYWPNVPIIEDVRNVTRESVQRIITDSYVKRLEEQRLRHENEQSSIKNQGNGQVSESVIANTDIIRCDGQQVEQRETQTGRRWFRENNQLTLLSAGCPCQPASSAGKRRGKADDRWLWPEAIRVLSELQPTWAVFENPVGIGSLGEYGEILSMGDEAAQGLSDTEAVELDRLCGQIEACGYEVQPVSIPACAVGAPHERQRIFIICHATDKRQSRRGNTRTGRAGFKNANIYNPDTNEQGLQIGYRETNGRGIIREERQTVIPHDQQYWQSDWYSKAIELCQVKTQPGVRPLDAGSTVGLLGLSRTAKMKMIGNCNPPQLYYSIFKAIADIEKSKE